MAPIGLKLCQNAFQTIPDISFFDAEKKNREFFERKNSVFRKFGQVFEELRPNGLQIRIGQNCAPDRHLLRFVRQKTIKI